MKFLPFASYFIKRTLYFSKITKTPLLQKSWFKFLNQHKNFVFNWMILAHKTWIVTVFPPKKNLVPRFKSRKELEVQISKLGQRKSGEFPQRVSLNLPSYFFFCVMNPLDSKHINLLSSYTSFLVWPWLWLLIHWNVGFH